MIAVANARPLIDHMTGERLHAKQVQSVTNAVVGLVHAVSLTVHAIGAGLAAASGGQAKHAIKQVDRLLTATSTGTGEIDVPSHEEPPRAGRATGR